MVIWEKFRPILVVPAIPNNDGISFLRQDQQLDINGEIVKALWKILSFCNGYNTFEEIVKLSELNRELVKSILLELNEQKIITDSCEQYKHFHAISSYPAGYIQNLTEEEIKKHKKSKRKTTKKGETIKIKIDKNSALYSMQSKRKSCRNFSVNKKININQLANICEYAYSIKHHATPSGGALYPLKIYCVVTKDQQDFSAGYYEYNAEKSELVLYKKDFDLEQLKYCYNDESLAFNSPVQIIISADLDRQPFKYSNRGYRLTLIEVGQAAQNISLYCVEKGLSSCELGGILDLPLAKELEIEENNIFPILAIAIGYSSNKKNFKYNELLSKVAKEYVGETKPVKSFGVNSLNINNSSFYGAWAKYGENGNRIAGATASSYNEAVCKAILEAYERYRSGIIKVDYIGKEKNTEHFFKPEEIAPLTQEQRYLWNLSEYSVGDTIEWTKDMSGKYYIPTDFVFYGHQKPKEKKMFLSDSSGIAAYSDYEGAKQRALAELIERDAVMRSWYERRSPKHVNPNLFSQHLKNRIKHWEKQNRKIHILDLESEHLPVYLVVIVSNEYPCFVSGSAAKINNFGDAMQKALQEAEYNLLLALEHPISKPPQIDKIKSPLDHGQYFHFLENAKKIDWLWTNDTYSEKKYSTISTDEIIKKLEVVFVDLSESSESLIKVVRAVSRKTIPIAFGYNRDYYLHPEIQKINFNPKSREIPHYFA